MTKKLIIRFEKTIVEQSTNTADIVRIVGFMAPEYLLKIVKNVGLEANPRYAHENRVTKDIMTTLSETPELFPFKSRGS